MLGHDHGTAFRKSVRGTPRVGGILAACLLAVLASGTPAVAQGDTQLEGFGLLIAGQSRPSFTIIGAGARASAMGGAFTALADDASAASFNPAGLALLLTPELSLVIDGQSRRDRYPAFTNSEAGQLEFYTGSELSFSTSDLNFLAATVPFRVAGRNLCLQLSHHRLIDFTFEGTRNFQESLDPGAAPFARYRQQVEQGGDLSTLSLAAAYQLTQRLSLGVALARWEGGWRFFADNSETELPEDTVDFIRYLQDNDLVGWNWTFGMLLRYPYLDVGATVRSGFDADYTFSSTLETNVPTELTSQPPVTRTLHWPDSWTVGIAVKPTPIWTLTADYSRFYWSEMEIRGVGAGGADLNFFDLRPSASTITPDVEHWRAGTEVTLFAGRTPIFLRAGYFHEPEPRGIAVDGEIVFDGYTAGVGASFGPFSVDLAYQRRSGEATVQQLIDPSIIASGQLQAQAEGQLETVDERFYLAFHYQFSSNRGVKKALKFLFVGPTRERGEPLPETEGGTEGGAGEPPR